MCPVNCTPLFDLLFADFPATFTAVLRSIHSGRFPFTPAACCVKRVQPNKKHSSRPDKSQLTRASSRGRAVKGPLSSPGPDLQLSL